MKVKLKATQQVRLLMEVFASGFAKGRESTLVDRYDPTSESHASTVTYGRNAAKQLMAQVAGDQAFAKVMKDLQS